MMADETLSPFKLLVEHLVSQIIAINPTTDLFKGSKDLGKCRGGIERRVPYLTCQCRRLLSGSWTF